LWLGRDKTAHNPVVHWPQLAYFSVFAFGLSAPHQLLVTGATGLRDVWGGGPRCQFALLAGAGFTLGSLVYAVHYHTFAHKYLLADNRHYTFYVWKLFFRREGAVLIDFIH
jgi:alpha-1,2-glucosyltransferase